MRKRISSRGKLPVGGSRFNPLKVQVSKTRPITRSVTTPTVRGRKRLEDRFYPWLRWPTRETLRFSWRKFFIVLGGFVAVLVLGIAITFAIVVRDLPNPHQLSAAPDQSTKLLDRNGKLLYSFYGDQNRTLLTSDQISPNIKQATVALEDATFYQNPGFALKGIARAVFCRISHTCVAGGGSTITQQYVKNALLTQDQTLSRKIKDLFLAVETEQVYTKDEILTGYLNTISYGGSVYGIEAASQMYFGKSAKDLTLAEAATLASIPQRPAYYSPYGSHLDGLFRRKDYTLDRMAEVGYITQDQANAAKNEAPNLANPDFSQRSNLLAPHFVFYVRQQLLDFVQAQNNVDAQTAENLLDTSGYVVTTSLDLDTQKLAESIMADMGPSTVKTWGASNAALTSVDPNNGQILAMVGSIDYGTSKSGNTNFANALLQPGSSFKPIVYATSFDKTTKMSPASVLYDLQTDFGGGYTPQNYNGKFNGPVTVRTALAGSLNIPAVKTLGIVGVPAALDTAKRLGITSLNDTANYGLSLVLGAGEVRPVELANAYASFENGGKHYNLTPILNIKKDGKLVKDFTTDQPTQALEPDIAAEITSILSDNNARSFVFGTHSALTMSDRPVAAKSGTTQSNRDAWTVGYTPQIVTAVWVGNNEANKTMNKGADGSVVAAPIWNRFMREYLKGKPVVNFTVPDDLKTITVDRLSGKLPTDQSPQDQRITDIFASWQIPTANDDVHVLVKIDKTTGALATDLTPAEDIVQQFYIKIHSEKPDNPNWENPVQAWAAANGGGPPPPSATDTVHVEANRPTISITNPTANSTLTGTFNLSANPGGPAPITKVEFFINNVSVGSRTEAPWTIQYDSSSLPPGTQIVTATATNNLGLTRSDQVTVNKPGSDTTAPAAVTSVKVSKTGGRSVHITWENPSDSDLASVNIYQSTSSGVLGARAQNVSATPGTAGQVDLSNLPLGTIYFTLRPVDTTGNENASGDQTSFLVTGP